MSRLWNAIGQRYEDAVAIFAAAGRLVDYDDSGAVVTVNGEERLLEPAMLVTAAMMMARNNVANGYTGHTCACATGAGSNTDIERVIDGEEIGQEANAENLDGIAQPATEEICGLCGEPLHICAEGPCPWGDPTPARWDEARDDWVALRTYDVYYAKIPRFSLHWAEPSVDRLHITHELVATIPAASLEEVFEKCNTDPRTLEMIAEKGMSHTSMSVGDVAFDGETYWGCADMGWIELASDRLSTFLAGLADIVRHMADTIPHYWRLAHAAEIAGYEFAITAGQIVIRNEIEFFSRNEQGTWLANTTGELLTDEEMVNTLRARAVCIEHADQLSGWEEAWCPICEAEYWERIDAIRDFMGGISQIARHMLEEAAPNTASGQLDANERRHTMMLHDCPVLNRKNLFAGPDGYCRHCRSVELAAQILDREVEELTGPSFEELLEEVGGEDAYRASLEDIRHAKHNGRPGNAVAGRVPRELLNLIMTQHPMFIADLLDKYCAFAGQFGIALRHDPDGVLFHDYAVFAPVQPTFPAMVPDLNGNTLRDYTWQANVAEKRVMRDAFVEGVRASRQIVMSWVSSDGTESGTCTLGPNTEETRLLASEYQAAARKKGFRTRFSLVQG